MQRIRVHVAWLVLLGLAHSASAEDAAPEPTYSWIEIGVGATESDPEGDLQQRRVLEEQLQQAESRGRTRRITVLLGRTAPLLVNASNQLWLRQLQSIDHTQDVATAFEALDTTDADALRDEALRRYERALDSVDRRAVRGLARQANGWRLEAGRLWRERQDYAKARAMLGQVVDGPATRIARRAAAMELGEMQFEDGDIRSALDTYQVAARLGGDSDRGAYAQYRIGWCHLRLGEWQGATGSLLQASQEAEDRSLARQARSDALWVATQLEVDEALAVVDAACAEDLGCRDSERRALASRLDATGRPDAADAVRSLR